MGSPDAKLSPEEEAAYIQSERELIEMVDEVLRKYENPEVREALVMHLIETLDRFIQTQASKN